MTGLLVLYALTLTAFLWMLRDQSKQHVAQLEEQANAHHEETMHLLNRIQAPSIAVAESLSPEDDGELQYIPFDDDDAYDKAS